MLLFYIIIILMIYLCVFRSLMRPCGMPSSLRLVAYLLWCSLLLSLVGVSIGRMRELNGYPSLLQSGPFRYDRGQIEEAAALLGVAMRHYLSPYWRSALLSAPPPRPLSLALSLYDCDNDDHANAQGRPQKLYVQPTLSHISAYYMYHSLAS